MFRLTTLGGLTLTNGAGPIFGPAARPHSLALLAFVAAAGSRGVTRDRLLAYFWPESDEGRARNCLKQAVFAIRRGLDADPFARGVATFQIDAAVMTVDAQRFDEAIASGRLREAAMLYQGDYLEGFHLAGLAELDQWMEEARARRRYACRRALCSLAAEAQSAGRGADAVRWWQRLAALDPFGSRTALGLMRSLVAAGEWAEALRVGRCHERLLQEEFNAEPDIDVQLFLQELRACGRRAADRPTATPAKPRAAAQTA